MARLRVQVVYRDRETGRFACLSTWRRSKAHGGTRYVRQRFEVKRVPKPKPPAKPSPPLELEEEEILIEEEEEFKPYDLEGSADYEEPE